MIMVHEKLITKTLWLPYVVAFILQDYKIFIMQDYMIFSCNFYIRKLKS
jgi:hypothetical protein